MISRRQILKQSALVAMAPMVPAFLANMARAAGTQRDSRILVVVQMEGGNDGINTLVPFGDEGYARNRKELRIAADKVLKLNDHVGLHPSMRGAAKLVEDGRLAIVQGVGYPNPSRSHFHSMEIWQTALLDPQKSERGWIGRAFDGLPWPRAGGPDAVYVGNSDMPQALIGRRTDAAAISNADDLALHLPAHSLKQADEKGEDLSSFVRRSVLSAYGTANDLAGAAKGTGGAAPAAYPQSKLATQLQLISTFIKSGAGTRVYYAAQSGYDTHQLQMPQHEDLLGDLSSAMRAFLDDLKGAGLSDRVLLMAFSEFGRRVAENSSLGTDHGAAAPLFVAGAAVKGGLIGTTPSLSELVDGDVKMSIDFRQVYATLLENWLQIPAKQVLAGEFEPLPLLKQA
ncbi:MAG TPA: DUF1501 domain-containing protein [Humisphaera sp.]|nr:DUF1501 domain-containing protein [Humisphaera sp.]